MKGDFVSNALSDLLGDEIESIEQNKVKEKSTTTLFENKPKSNNTSNKIIIELEKKDKETPNLDIELNRDMTYKINMSDIGFEKKLLKGLKMMELSIDE